MRNTLPTPPEPAGPTFWSDPVQMAKICLKASKDKFLYPEVSEDHAEPQVKRVHWPDTRYTHLRYEPYVELSWRERLNILQRWRKER